MKLKKLEINGFKSFDQRTSVEFPPGVSAIVGPNGCGKSNLVDAIRWVMGEQSVKQLRGKSMEDIIFAGTNGKPPLNMAEVSLTLINDNGSAPEELKDFSEIMLTRRLYRSGESAYLINKQHCRLKDIHNVFMGSGLGARSYAVIQQGNIGAITDAGPEERRYFIEEAAGVTRFISRKTEALRKVQATNQNLMRISDIINEVRRQMNSLQRQARKAELYNKYQESIKIFDVRLADHYFEQLARKSAETDALVKSLKDIDIAQNTQLKKLDAAVEDIKHQRWQKNQEISDQKNKKFETQRRIDRKENDLAHLRKDVQRLSTEISELETAHAEIEQKNRRIQAEIDEEKHLNATLGEEVKKIGTHLSREQETSQGVRDELAQLNRALDISKQALMDKVAREAQYKNIYQNASHNKAHLKSRLKRADEEEALAARKVAESRQAEKNAQNACADIRREIENLGTQIETAKEGLDQKSSELGRQVKIVQTIEFERGKTRSQYSALKKMEDNYEWYKDGVKAIMKIDREDPEPAGGDRHWQPDGIVGLMADVLDPAPSYETAVEAALGESLQHILVKDQSTGRAAIDYLQTSGSGRSGFIPLSAVKNMGADGDRKPDASRRLLNHVSVKKGFEDIAEALLGHVILASDIQDALAVFNRNGVIQTLVTPNGDVISPQGIMIGGSPENLAGILKKKQELKELEQQLNEYDRALAAGKEKQSGLESEVKKLEAQLYRLTEQKGILAQDEIEAQKAIYKAAEELKHACRHLEIIRLEQERLLGEESDADEEISRYQTLLTEITGEVESAQKEAAGLSEKISAVSARLEDFNQRHVDLKLKLTSLNARLENSSNTLGRLREFREEGLNRYKQIAREIIQKKDKRDELESNSEEAKRTLADMYADMKRVEQSLEANESDYQAIDRRLKENDGVISEIHGKREKTLQKIRLLELEQSERNMKQDHIKDRIEERYRLPFADLKAVYRTAENFDQPADMSIEEMEAQLNRLREKVSKITDVNLGAIREFEQNKERFDFLSGQRDDLVSSVEDLHKVIGKINKITKKRFLETFEQVNEKLKEVFPRLFEGGTAQLVLTEPDKPLETGVEFMIHPPGKKLTRLSLLSGGEKALSAIAFIFAIFLIKPASFCLMDEIDAPLDDVNVYRFNDLLKIIGEKSQIVMITHNKNTMEFADMLFGVTMENKGISKIVSVNLN